MRVNDHVLIRSEQGKNMETKRTHPLILAAAASVLLLSAVGSAALLGWLPGSHGNNSSSVISDTEVKPAAHTAVTTQTTAEQIVEPAPAKPKPVARKAEPRPAPVKVVQTVYEAPATQPAVCHDCGIVESVREVTEAGEGSGLGAVIGGVTGGVVGRQFGGGRGKDVMTVVGVVGGGIAGHQIEKRVRGAKYYEVTVRFTDGSSRIFRQENANWQVGERIRLINGQLTRDA